MFGARAEKPPKKADFAMKQTNICRLSGDITSMCILNMNYEAIANGSRISSLKNAFFERNVVFLEFYEIPYACIVDFRHVLFTNRRVALSCMVLLGGQYSVQSIEALHIFLACVFLWNPFYGRTRPVPKDESY